MSDSNQNTIQPQHWTTQLTSPDIPRSSAITEIGNWNTVTLHVHAVHKISMRSGRQLLWQCCGFRPFPQHSRAFVALVCSSIRLVIAGWNFLTFWACSSCGLNPLGAEGLKAHVRRIGAICDFHYGVNPMFSFLLCFVDCGFGFIGFCLNRG